MKRYLIVFACVFITSISISATDNPSGSFIIKGMVIDSLTNEPVSFATVSVTSLSDASGMILGHSVCDIDGSFAVELAQPGLYQLALQYVGKAPVTRELVFPDNKKELNVGSLYMQDANQQLGEVTVVAQKPLVKVDIDKLVYSMDDDPEAKVNNTLEMLRKVPMVTVDGEDNIQLKGSSDFKIYVNGRPSGLLSSNPSEVLKSMPASTVKNIEVVTDPGARYDAEGVGGIINIVTTRNLFDGYTGTVNLSASVLEEYEVGTFITAKAGRFGIIANYEYEYAREPWSTMESVRENLTNDANRFLTQMGRTRENDSKHRGYLEASFEFDSLNMIHVGANLFRKKANSFTEYDVVMRNINQDLVYSYDRYTKSIPVIGGAEVNVDYQHATKKPGELLTLSYRFSNTPRDEENQTYITGLQNYEDINQWDINKAKTNEHTAQIDYVTPTWQGLELEIGAKYILRQSDSDIQQYLLNDSTGNWIDIADDERKFKHTQHIYSGYAGYTIKLNGFGIRAGLRAEGTSLDVKYDYSPERNFGTDYFDLVPNATLSYQLTDIQQLRIGYNMRIQRAGINHLNPYINTTDPLNITYGNPELSSVKSNGVNLNYSIFGRKFSLNATLSYVFINNSIERYTFMDPQQPGVSVTTYGNIGEKKQTGLFLYASWNPVQNIRVFVNASGDYTDLKSKQGDMTNNGFGGRIFGGAQATLPKDFRINANYAVISPQIQLQGRRSTFCFLNLAVHKDFFDKKLTVSLACNTPFRKNSKFETNSSDPTFTMRTTEYAPKRDLSLTISYRFGSLKEQMKKIKRGIVNDDMLNGNNN